jgi:tryptophan-rich sensory protein
MKQKLKQLAVSLFFIALCLFIGYLGTQLSGGSFKETYDNFIKPNFFPPAWIFAPVWTVLYILMGLSASMIWMKNRYGVSLVLFAFQLLANLVWSIVFFGINNYDFALGIIILLLVLIALMMRSFEKISKPAAYLLVPYLLWVGFATILNYTICLIY